MLGEFITRSLVLVLGYAYPAFQCFKIVEKNRVEIHELRFWCQYWIIVALLTVLERLGDVFVSWLPMYGEAKLALIIYLWSPKTKGTGYIFETFLRPYMSRHETDIDRKLEEWRVRAWDFAIYYWKNCTELGQAGFFQMLQYLGSQSTKLKNSKSKPEDPYLPSAPPIPEASSSSFFSRFRNRSSKKQPPSPPPSSPRSPTVHRSTFQASKIDTVHFRPQTDVVWEEYAASAEEPIEETRHTTRSRPRRSRPH